MTAPDRTLDIRGVVCPLTFVKSKLALEQMVEGQVLEIITDYEPATRSIAKAMDEHGNAVLSLEQITKTDWRITIQKGGE